MRHAVAFTLLAAALLLAPQTASHAAIVDFGNTVNNPFSPTETYTEDGFQFTVISGAVWGIQSNVGNPPSGLAAGNSGPIAIGDTISVTRIGGGLFTFTAVDYASFSGSLSDGVNLVGFVGNVQTEIFSNLNSQAGFQTLNPLFANPIDELRIIGASQGNTDLNLDNFVLNEVSTVPEPATLALLVGGLMGLAAARRRRAR